MTPDRYFPLPRQYAAPIHSADAVQAQLALEFVAHLTPAAQAVDPALFQQPPARDKPSDPVQGKMRPLVRALLLRLLSCARSLPLVYLKAFAHHGLPAALVPVRVPDPVCTVLCAPRPSDAPGAYQFYRPVRAWLDNLPMAVHLPSLLPSPNLQPPAGQIRCAQVTEQPALTEFQMQRDLGA